MRKGMAAGRMPPKILLEKVVTQADGIATQRQNKVPSFIPLTNSQMQSPKRIASACARRLAAVRDSVTQPT